MYSVGCGQRSSSTRLRLNPVLNPGLGDGTAGPAPDATLTYHVALGHRLSSPGLDSTLNNEEEGLLDRKSGCAGCGHSNGIVLNVTLDFLPLLSQE